MSAPAALPVRPLGATGIDLTAIGFGGGPIGGFYGPVDTDVAVLAVRRAFHLGIRYFDVAPLYGHGRAESILGHALRDTPRDSFILSTKVGRYLVPAGVAGTPERQRAEGAPFNPVLDYGRDGVLRSLEQSLHRLGMARIDIAYIHDVDEHSQGSDAEAEAAFGAAMRGALPALQELKRAGTIRAIGVGLNQPAWALRWIEEADIDAVMLAGRLTLLNREAEQGVLQACSRRGVAYIAAGAFNGGILARGTDNDARFNYRPASAAVNAEYRRLSGIAASHGVSLKAAALQFVLRHPGVCSLVAGAASATEVDEDIQLAAAPIPDDFWAEADTGRLP